MLAGDQQNTGDLGRLRAAIQAIRRAAAVSLAPPSVTPALGPLIAQIRDAVLRTFEAERSRYEGLLGALERTGVPLGALSVCGRGTREIRYTRLLAYFLSPLEPHGLGFSVLAAAFDPEVRQEASNIADFQWDQAEVKAEFSLGEVEFNGKKTACTIDLFIKMRTLVILMEHKINSSEHGAISSGEVSQLRRYSEAFSQNFPSLRDHHILKIYLTPDGRAPKEDRYWKPLTHDVLIARLRRLLDGKVLSSTAKHNLSCLLWDLLGGPLSFDRTRQIQLGELVRAALDQRVKYLELRRWAAEYLPSFDTILRIVETSNG
jgi:hypothetical protein